MLEIQGAPGRNEAVERTSGCCDLARTAQDSAPTGVLPQATAVSDPSPGAYRILVESAWSGTVLGRGLLFELRTQCLRRMASL